MVPKVAFHNHCIIRQMMFYATDVDECLIGNHSCQHMCRDTEGSYYCECHKGWRVSSNGKNCTGEFHCMACPLGGGGGGELLFWMSQDVEGELKRKELHMWVSLHGLPSGGSVQTERTAQASLTSCPLGGREVLLWMSQEVEGEFKRKELHRWVSLHVLSLGGRAIIVNVTRGRGTAEWFHGHWSISHVFTDFNECAEPQSYHHCNQYCVNTPGSYYCKCKEGFVLSANGRICRGTYGSKTFLEGIFSYFIYK